MKFETQKFRDALNSNIELTNRIRHSEDFLVEIRDKTSTHLGSKWGHVSVFVAGSLGRFETGRKSDLDVFLLAKSIEPNKKGTTRFPKLEEIQLLSKLIQVNTSLGLPEFSGDGRYLKVHDVNDIVESTGDANDDSENYFTTRLLLLLESKSIWNDELRQEAIEQVLENYFKDGKGKKDFRPLFLLNDILRYWRTICLNYERDRIAPTAKWWKKNLNLKFSRKLTVYSTILAIVTKAVETKQELIELTNMVPLQRLASVLDVLGDESFLDDFHIVLQDYEAFLAAKSHGEVDNPINDLTKLGFRDKADRFGGFFINVIMSHKIDSTLRNYLLI
jgi:predicted nucleotidyltransferase